MNLNQSMYCNVAMDGRHRFIFFLYKNKQIQTIPQVVPIQLLGLCSENFGFPPLAPSALSFK